MKTKEELNALKEEVETLNKKLAELSEEELKAVTGGYVGGVCGEDNGLPGVELPGGEFGSTPRPGIE